MLYSPNSAVLDMKNNRIIVADNRNHVIKVFDTNGNFVSKFGERGSDPSQFENPTGVAISPNQEIYITDGGNGRIQIFDPNFNFIRALGYEDCTDGIAGGFCYPEANVVFDSKGNVYVPDTWNNQIQVFDSRGNFIKFINPTGSAIPYFDGVYQLFIDLNDNLFVTDSGNTRIVKFNSNGEYLSEFGSYGTGDGEFDYPMGLVLDAAGNIYVGDYHKILKFNSNFEFIEDFGTYGYENGNFTTAPFLSITGNSLITSEPWNGHRLQVFLFPQITLYFDKDVNIINERINLKKGENFTFNLQLDAPPKNPVYIIMDTIGAEDYISISHKKILTFDQNNWNIPQAVTLQIYDKENTQSNNLFQIQFNVASDDIGYNDYNIEQLNFILSADYLPDEAESDNELSPTGQMIFLVWIISCLILAIAGYKTKLQ